MNTENIRWVQRLNNFKKAFLQLQKAVELAQSRQLTELEQQGLIQAFEFTHELSWNVMKDYFRYQGNTDITGSRDAIQQAFKAGLIQDGTLWIETIKSRNKSSHTYNEETADEILAAVVNNYFPLFQQFLVDMEKRKEKL